MKILLLCEAPMDRNAGGISQTLYNIFSFCDPQNILCISPELDITGYPPSEPFQNRYIGYRFEIIRLRANRLTKWLKPAIDLVNFSLNQFRPFTRLKQQILEFQPDIIVSCPNGAVGVMMHHKLLKDLRGKVFPYFMDDWMYNVRTKWVGGSVHSNIKRMLAENRNWLMISHELAGILTERYKVIPEAVLCIQNPVNLENAPQNYSLIKKEKYRIAYAGALWPMHYDGFYAIAKAVNIINSTERKQIELVVYTGQQYWQWRKNELLPLGVNYGGSIPYSDIHAKLNEADFLIVTSSFSDELFTHSKGSVQTKITDYLKSRRLIVSCGPEYSANHSFLRNHKCGYCITTNVPEKIAQELEHVANDICDYQYMITNGWELLENNFTFEVIHKKLIAFLSDKNRNTFQVSEKLHNSDSMVTYTGSQEN